jgi:glycosyltransferase involved in cell wall biosynthesis
MKIGFDAKRIYHNATGLGNYSRDMVCVMSRYYTEALFYLYNPKSKKIDRLENRPNVFEVNPDSRFWRNFSSIWRQGPIVKQLLNDNIELFHGLSGEVPRGLKSANIKSVVTIHDLIFVRYPALYKYMDRKIHFKKFSFAAKQSDVIIAISEQTKRDIVDFLKIDPNKIVVIYQGCHKFFKEKPSDLFKKQVKEKYKLPDRFILSVGTIEERKNLLTTVKAVKDIDEKLIVIGGKTKYYETVKKYIAENEMENKVIFLENVDLKELVCIYQMSSLFVYPSLFEGFGIPIIEALYSKTPVITSKGGCFSEAAGPNSFYVDSLNEVELRDKIVEILSNDDLANEMKEKGYQFVQKFNDSVIANEIMNVYKEVIDEN